MLPKANRIRNTKQYDQIYRKGRKHYTPYFLLYILRGAGLVDRAKPLPRFGFVASKKVGKAVERNRAKRVMRGIVREMLPELKRDFEAVVITFPALLKAETADVAGEFRKVAEGADLFAKG
ncbi:MAG: ribonuclease P protein component [Candidatus Dojkabacteria bacterium]